VLVVVKWIVILNVSHKITACNCSFEKVPFASYEAKNFIAVLRQTAASPHRYEVISFSLLRLFGPYSGYGIPNLKEVIGIV